MKTNVTKSHIPFKKDNVACKTWMLCYQALVKKFQHYQNKGRVEREPDWLSLVSWKPTMCSINRLWED